MQQQYAPNGTFTVATFSSITTESGSFIMSPREIVPPPAYSQGPCPVTQLVVIEYTTEPRAPGWVQGHELFLHLESAEFEELKRAIMDRRPKDPPVTITWTNRENGFLEELCIEGGAAPIEPQEESEEQGTVTKARRIFPAPKAVAGGKN